MSTIRVQTEQKGGDVATAPVAPEAVVETPPVSVPLNPALTALREIVALPLRFPEAFRSLGVEGPKGALFGDERRHSVRAQVSHRQS